MRLNLNLATRPYEDVSSFLRRWGMYTLILALVTAGLVYFAVHNWRESRDVNRQISRMQGEIAKLDKDRAEAVIYLNKPENKVISDQSKFLNAAIQRKSLSWTRIFMDLERIMPSQLHVVSITPELNKQNQLLIHLLVAGQSSEKANELLRKMEESPSFRDAQLLNETVNKDNTKGDGVQFDITSIYVPAGEQVPAASPGKNSTIARSGGAQ